MIETLGHAITLDAGLIGDHKGKRSRLRAVTVLAREDWEAALAAVSRADATSLQALDPGLPPVDLPWTARRANLLVEGIRLPRAVGAVLSIGPVVLEVTGQTYPCRRMDEARQGLLKALASEWRGGLTCRVVQGGDVSIGDDVGIASSPPERVRRLP
ncbi:MAG: MOSC domain-containing protein [Hyphomicrobiaceae bacterium]